MAVVVDSDRVLMIRRRVQEGRLSWAFPGGKIEPGETAEAAAVREVLEETGLTVALATVLGQRVHPDTGRLIAYVACAAVSGEAHVAAPEEVAEIAWATLDDIPRLVPHGLFKPVQDYLDGVLDD
ncbi:NUDIX hydrolase [Streptomyces sp. NPDC001852]|uniref:NUDIX hydrolase n=1 Tax=Streptomyces sp. NPDC001852 TaxID=3364619 RepID=UPI00368B4313